MEKPARIRFEDRTRWAPMCFLHDDHSLPKPYVQQHTPERNVSRQVTSIIYRMITHKDPL